MTSSTIYGYYGDFPLQVKEWIFTSWWPINLNLLQVKSWAFQSHGPLVYVAYEEWSMFCIQQGSKFHSRMYLGLVVKNVMKARLYIGWMNIDIVFIIIYKSICYWNQCLIGRNTNTNEAHILHMF